MGDFFVISKFSLTWKSLHKKTLFYCIAIKSNADINTPIGTAQIIFKYNQQLFSALL